MEVETLTEAGDMVRHYWEAGHLSLLIRFVLPNNTSFKTHQQYNIVVAGTLVEGR